MKAFEESDDYLFFGRNKEIDDLLKQFAVNRFLAVIGSSGSGKSSLVKSGMLPNIYGGFMKAGSNWRVALMQPGENPVGYLAKELAREGVLYADLKNSDIPIDSVIESRLRRSENGLELVYADAHLPTGENLLIVVDQFEELFRFSKYEKDNKLGKSDAMHFVQILLNASMQQECPIYVLLTMRSDFLGDCAEFRGLPEAINNGQYLVPRMTRDEIREAITGPVAVSGATISQRLVTRLLNDINNDTDQLPVLQHAMMRTWDAWFKRNLLESPIDFEDYEKIGTMKSALSQHADEIYAELSTEREEQICGLMFKALTDTSADLRGIRRPRSITDLCLLTDATQAEIKKQVEIFRKPGRTFLMPSPGIELTDDTIIDISHESLMRIWLRLINWTEEEARSGALYMRLASSAQLKEIGQRGLLKNPELDIALQWKEINNPTAKWAEGFKASFEKTMAYLEESKNEDLEEKKILAQKEATRKRLVRTIFGLLALLVIAGLVASFIFNNKKNEALKSERDALNSEIKALDARNAALRSDSLRGVALTIAKQMESLAKLARDTALNAKERADISAKIAKLKEREANTSEQIARTERDNAETQRNKAEQLKEEATENVYKNAPSEYARLIREGPSDIKRIRAEDFDLKLTAYTQHLELLGPKIMATNDPEAAAKYNNLMNRLYYNNDLYEKIYSCIDDTKEAPLKRKLFTTDVPAKTAMDDEPDRNDQAYITIRNEMQQSGRTINKYLEDKKDQRVICTTNDNWIYVYNHVKNVVNRENAIPMGAPVTALDYNSEKNIIYFGLETGNIGYIRYNKDKKNQPVFENALGTAVIAIQFFKTAVKGNLKYFLLAAGKKSSVQLYELDENSLVPDKKLLGNILPQKNLGVLIGARFDAKSQLVLIKGQLPKSNSPTFYSWNPFTALVLDEYKKYKNEPKYFDATKIY